MNSWIIHGFMDYSWILEQCTFFANSKKKFGPAKSSRRDVSGRPKVPETLLGEHTFSFWIAKPTSKQLQPYDVKGLALRPT